MRIVIAVAVLLFSTTLLANDSRVHSINREAANLGIGSYDITTEDNVVGIVARDAHDAPVAEIMTSTSLGVRQIHVSLNSGHDIVTLFWNPKTATATVQEQDGSRYEIGMDFAGRLTGTDASKAALARHFDALQLGAAVVAELGELATSTTSLPKRFRVKPQMAIDPGQQLEYESWSIGDWWDFYPYPFWETNGAIGSGPIGGSTSPEPSCTGPIVRGWAFFLSDAPVYTRSTACASARADANYKCWNSACTGCCAFDACDAYCILGDYVCVQAGITGTACRVGG
jgi:hypothetical protein